MQAEAIAKINNEMESSTNPYIKFVGDYLLGHLEQHPEDAAKILNKDKTIGKSLEEMRKVAEKRKVGNCAVLSDAEGFAVVLKYFQEEAPAKAAPTPAPAKAVKAPPAVEAASAPDETDLDDELAAMLL
jgi:hypothetical protein